MVCLSTPHPFKLFKCCLQQNLLSTLFSTLFHIIVKGVSPLLNAKVKLIFPKLKQKHHRWHRRHVTFSSPDLTYLKLVNLRSRNVIYKMQNWLKFCKKKKKKDRKQSLVLFRLAIICSGRSHLIFNLPPHKAAKSHMVYVKWCLHIM